MALGPVAGSLHRPVEHVHQAHAILIHAIEAAQLWLVEAVPRAGGGMAKLPQADRYKCVAPCRRQPAVTNSLSSLQQAKRLPNPCTGSRMHQRVRQALGICKPHPRYTLRLYSTCLQDTGCLHSSLNFPRLNSKAVYVLSNSHTGTCSCIAARLRPTCGVQAEHAGLE